MVELYVKEKDFDSAYHVLEVMKNRKKVLTNYVDQNLINQICNAVGKSSILSNNTAANKTKYNEIQDDDDI